MKSISVEIKRSIAESNSGALVGTGIGIGYGASPSPDFKLNSRLLVRTKDGVFITTLVKAQADSLVCKGDNGRQLVVKASSRALIGEGIQRKRKTAIPDDELYMWRKEIRASSIKAKAKPHSKTKISKDKGSKEC